MNPTLSRRSSSSLSLFNRKLIEIFFLFIFLLIQSVSLFAQTRLVTCPADIVQNNDPGTCTAIVNFPSDANSDPNLSVSYSRPSGTRFPIGSTAVVMQLFDQNGTEVSSCSFNVIVLDKEAPVISNSPGNLAVSNDKDACGATVSFAPPVVTDKCTFQQKTFNYTGAPATFVVPAGVTSINVDLKGAAGGRTYYNQSAFSFPGFGGETQTTISVTPGQVLVINVGGAGRDGSAVSAGAGGYNGGGNGTASTDANNVIEFAGGGGGGASDIRTAGGSLSDRIIVAGGGGAAGFTHEGGQGGGLTGGTGGGETSTDFTPTTEAMGGSQTAGGAGASYSNEFYAGNGSAGIGGAGAAMVPGGGGGGGFFGGGGGSFSGGAGGSSYAIAGAVNVYHLQGVQEGNGSVTLSYNQPATLIQTAGLPSGATFPVGETINTFTATDAAGNVSTSTFKVTVSDTQKPILSVPAAQTFDATASTYNIPVSVATDNCGIASITYSVTGATTRSGTGADASGVFNPGTSIVSFTATDVHGNVQTGTTNVTVSGSASEPGSPASKVSINIADVWAVSPWGNPNTIYLGFGPASLTFNANVTSGISPFTYAWRKAGSVSVLSTTASLSVSLAGVYTVTVTDKSGAIATASKEVKVEDLRCGTSDDKISVCHMPVDGSNKMRTICVSRNSVDKFLGNGNYLGSCKESTTSSTTIENEMVAGQIEMLVTQTKQLGVYPNPATGQLTVQLNSHKTGKAEVLFLSETGSTIQRKTLNLNGTGQRVTFNTSNVAAGIYLVKLVSEEGTQTAKVVVVH